MKAFTLAIFAVLCASTFAQFDGFSTGFTDEADFFLIRKYECFVDTMQQVSEMRGFAAAFMQNKNRFQNIMDTFRTCGNGDGPSGVLCRFKQVAAAVTMTISFFQSTFARDPSFFAHVFSTYFTSCEAPEFDGDVNTLSFAMIGFVKCANSTIRTHLFNNQEDAFFDDYEPFFAKFINKLRRCAPSSNEQGCIVDESNQFMQTYEAFKADLKQHGSDFAGKMDVTILSECAKFKPFFL